MKLATKTRRPKQPAKDDPEQARAFIQEAREIGADQETRAEALWANWRERPRGRARSEHKLRSAAQAKSLAKNRIDAPSWASVISRRTFDKFMAALLYATAR